MNSSRGSEFPEEVKDVSSSFANSPIFKSISSHNSPLFGESDSCSRPNGIGITTSNQDSMDERQVTIIMLLSQVCSLYDPTPRTFVLNVLRFHKMGLIDSVAFLKKLGLLPPSFITSSMGSQLIQIDEVNRGGGLVDMPRMKATLNFDSEHFTSVEALNVSRYQREFQEIRLIGKGAFGNVFMAQHRLDGNFYAVKKVTFRNNGFNNPYIRKVLREVHCLARCDHPHVNRYYSAWLEPTWLPTSNHTSLAANVTSPTIESLGIEQRRRLLQGIHQLVQTPLRMSKSLLSLSSLHPEVTTLRKCISIDSSVSRDRRINNSFASLSLDEHTSNVDATSDRRDTSIDSLLDYISADEDKEENMLKFELPPPIENATKKCNDIRYENRCDNSFPIPSCDDDKLLEKENLQDDVRDSTAAITVDQIEDAAHPEIIRKSTNRFTYQITLYIQMYLCEQSTLRKWIDGRNLRKEKICHETNLRLFKQLVEGMAHVHRQGIVHRDLKPSNVFIGVDGNLKIGDFGLSKLLEKACDEEVNSLDEEDNRDEAKHVDMKLGHVHTSGVGTMTYASPEQISSKSYDAKKADSYSLGIILAELYVCFDTKMERAVFLKGIRSMVPHLPCELTVGYPEIANLILKLVAHNPQERPLPEELLSHPVFNYQKKEVESLKKQLKEKDEKLKKQEELIMQLQAALGAQKHSSE